jgi:RNA polymerase subunit RPABC4/transcription elongation factor Spt4
MGDRACYRDYCLECDAQVTIVDGECPDCGVDFREEEWA